MSKIKMKLRKEQRPQRRTTFNVAKLDDEEIKARFEQELKAKIENISSTSQVEEHWQKIKEAIKETAIETIGKKKGKHQKEWVSQEVTHLSEQRRKLRIDNSDRHQLNWLTREIKRKLKDRETWVQKNCDEIQCNYNAHRIRDAYKGIKRISEEFEMKIATIKDKNGTLLTHNTDIQRRWKEHFEELYNHQNNTDRSVLYEIPTMNLHKPTENILKEEVK